MIEGYFCLVLWVVLCIILKIFVFIISELLNIFYSCLTCITCLHLLCTHKWHDIHPMFRNSLSPFIVQPLG